MFYSGESWLQKERKKGFKEGVEEGEKKEREQNVEVMLQSRLFNIPKSLTQKIISCKNDSIYRAIVNLLITSPNDADFMQKANGLLAAQ